MDHDCLLFLQFHFPAWHYECRWHMGAKRIYIEIWEIYALATENCLCKFEMRHMCVMIARLQCDISGQVFQMEPDQLLRMAISVLRFAASLPVR